MQNSELTYERKKLTTVEKMRLRISGEEESYLMLQQLICGVDQMEAKATNRWLQREWKKVTSNEH